MVKNMTTAISWQLHHVKGRSFKHNKIAIGHWLVAAYSCLSCMMLAVTIR